MDDDALAILQKVLKIIGYSITSRAVIVVGYYGTGAFSMHELSAHAAGRVDRAAYTVQLAYSKGLGWYNDIYRFGSTKIERVISLPTTSPH